MFLEMERLEDDGLMLARIGNNKNCIGAGFCYRFIEAGKARNSERFPGPVRRCLVEVNRCNHRGRRMFLQEFTPFPPPKSDSDNDKVHRQNWTLEMVVMQPA